MVYPLLLDPVSNAQKCTADTLIAYKSPLQASHGMVMRHDAKKAAVKWFYDTVPLHAEATPGIAKDANRMLHWWNYKASY